MPANLTRLLLEESPDAIIATSAEGKVLALKQHASERPKRFEISVSDTGLGIRAEDQAAPVRCLRASGPPHPVAPGRRWLGPALESEARWAARRKHYLPERSRYRKHVHADAIGALTDARAHSHPGKQRGLHGVTRNCPVLPLASLPCRASPIAMMDAYGRRAQWTRARSIWNCSDAQT